MWLKPLSITISSTTWKKHLGEWASSHGYRYILITTIHSLHAKTSQTNTALVLHITVMGYDKVAAGFMVQKYCCK